MPVGPGIGANPSDFRAYEMVLRRVILTPMVTEYRSRFARASFSYQEAREKIGALYVPEGLDETARAAAMSQQIKLRRRHIAQWKAKMRRYLGVRVNLFADSVLRPIMEDRVRDNVALIRTIPERLHAKLINKTYALQSTVPFDQARLQEVLATEFGSTGYDLRRLTRDQTSKTMAQFSQARQEQAGVERYIWSTAGDERVRPTHEDNDGGEFRWDSPPSTGHPGEDFQCRCVAEPIFLPVVKGLEPSPRRPKPVPPVSPEPPLAADWWPPLV